MASLTWWTWVWASSELMMDRESMGSQRVRHDWVTELNQLKPLNQTRSSLFNECKQKFVGLFLVDASDYHKKLRSPF